MSILTDYAKNMLARALCGRRPALPGAVFAGLGTGGADATGLIGEPVGQGYARQAVAFGGTGAQRSTAAVRFAFTGAVGTLTHVGLFDAPSGGNPLTWSVLPSPLAVAGTGSVTVAQDAFAVAAG